MKIFLPLLLLILLGILVGSNLSPEITVIIFSQPTIILPIGIWLAIAIGLGLCSGIVIQLAIFIDRRLSQRQIRQLQNRLQQSDQDIFTYTSSKPETVGEASRNENRSSSTKTDRVDDPIDDRKFPQQNSNTSIPKKSLFNSYRSSSVVADPAPNPDRSPPKPSVKPIVNDSDDWDVEPISNRQLEWEDSISPRSQTSQSPNRSSNVESNSTFGERRNQKIDIQPEQTPREVYDADFRLIQPPYKQPIETEFDDDLVSGDFENSEIDESEDFNSSSPLKPTFSNRSTASKNSDDEDWGFDFEDRDFPIRKN